MWWKDMLWGFWNGMTAWFVLIAHALGKLEGKPVFDKTSDWILFGVIVAAAVYGVYGLATGSISI